MDDVESMPARGQPGYKRARVRRFVRRLLRLEDPSKAKAASEEPEDAAHLLERAKAAAEAAKAAAEARAAGEAWATAMAEARAAEERLAEKTKALVEVGAAEEAAAVAAEPEVAEDAAAAAQTRAPEASKSAAEAKEAGPAEATAAPARAGPEQFKKSSRLLFLPFRGTSKAVPPLPILDEEEERLVRSGERLRWQQPPGPGNREGRGFAVVELHANPDDVWRAITNFDKYVEFIQTVKRATAYDDPPEAPPKADNVCLYSFVVSRIRLRLDVRFTLDSRKRCAAWQLDKKSWVLHDSTGYWRVEPCADRPGIVRVWFCVGVRLAGRVPNFVLGLVARLGLDKATRWLKGLEHAVTPGK